jgi:hypothetical protein
MWPEHTIAEIGDALVRSRSAVAGRINRLKLEKLGGQGQRTKTNYPAIRKKPPARGPDRYAAIRRRIKVSHDKAVLRQILHDALRNTRGDK